MKIGFFDSGIGGATIFKEAIKRFPANYYYFADTLNMPYGTKEKEEVKKFAFKASEKLIQKGCKIIVVACNTATSAAISDLRREYKDIIFIGTEPGIKPAIDSCKDKKVIVTGTTITVNGEKLKKLIDRLNAKEKVELLALDKLVKFAENINTDNNEVVSYIKEEFKKYDLKDYSSVVLGCTHFPIYKEVFEEVLPKNIKVIDSCEGVVNNLITKAKNLDFESKESLKVNLILSKYDSEFISNFKKLIKIDNVNVI